MRNIKLVIEYEGTNYWGWQTQEKYPSIQEELENAIGRVTKERITLYGSGRTDAKVHALGHVANFYTESKIPSEKFMLAINNELPGDIRVLSSELVDCDFNSRFSATHKRYRYRIYIGEVARPLLRNYSYHIKHKLDIESMKAAASYLLGTHNFKSFRGRRSSIKSSVRTIYLIDIREIGDFVDIVIEGNSFLRNMVRIIAGTLIEVGLGERKADSIPWIVSQEERACAGHTAPAHGLFLEKVYYGQNLS